MRVVMVSVHCQQRPLAIGTKHWIRGNQHVALSILDVADRREQLVLSILWLRPFLRDELRGKELSDALPNLVILIHHKHVVGSPAIWAGGVRRGIRQSVIVVRALAASSQKSCKAVGQPQPAKNIDGRFS